MEREHVAHVFERKMQELIELLVKEERWSSVLEWGERWIALGQTPEPAYRALMVAYAAQGDPAKVAFVYQRCVEALRNDLGMEPSAETRAYMTSSRAAKTRASHPDAPFAGFDSALWHGHVFV